MRFAIASGFGCALSWWARLQDEGHDVLVWIGEETSTGGPKTMYSHRSVGEGLVPRTDSWMELMAFAREPDTIMLFDSSGLGGLAEQARKAGITVVGGGKFCDRLEKDRGFGQEIAEQAGAQLPPYQEFGSFGECLNAARSMDKPMYFKSDRYVDSDATHGADTGEEMAEYLEGLIKKYGAHGKCILQEKIDGVPLSTARWWNGRDWVGPYQATYENKKFMNDNVGTATGCSFNVVWFYQHEPEIARQLGWDNLTEAFRKNNAPPGIYDINCIVAEDGTAYFLEWTPRLGYDSEMTSFRLLPDLGEFLHAVAYGHDVPEPYEELAYSVRLSIPPYPWEHGKKDEKGTADGTQLRGVDGLWDGNFIAYQVRLGEDQSCLEVAGPEALVGLTLAVGDELPALHKEVIDYAKKKLKVSGTSLQYRTDGERDCRKMAEKLVEAGYDIHMGLLVESDEEDD